jgi:hypothetical protein
VVNLGDALFHVAWIKPTEGLTGIVGEVAIDPLFDEDEIV